MLGRRHVVAAATLTPIAAGAAFLLRERADATIPFRRAWGGVWAYDHPVPDGMLLHRLYVDGWNRFGVLRISGSGLDGALFAKAEGDERTVVFLHEEFRIVRLAEDAFMSPPTIQRGSEVFRLEVDRPSVVTRCGSYAPAGLAGTGVFLTRLVGPDTI